VSLLKAISQFWHPCVSVFQDLMLPTNVTATTSVAEAIAGARYAVHALPVQHSRAFLTSIKVRACLVPNCRSTQLGTKGCLLVNVHLHIPPPCHASKQTHCSAHSNFTCSVSICLCKSCCTWRISASTSLCTSLRKLAGVAQLLQIVSWANCRTYCRMMYLSSRSAKA